MPWLSHGRAYWRILAAYKGWSHKNARAVSSASFPCRVNHNPTLQHYRLPGVTASVTKLGFMTEYAERVLEGFDRAKVIISQWTSLTKQAWTI